MNRLVTGVALSAVALLASGCGERSPFVDPVGQPMLPDLAPVPPVDMQMIGDKGNWYISFSSTLVNIGPGDFVLVARRAQGRWHVRQGIRYSQSGGRLEPTKAPVVWGGDGHDHWHIRRVATMRLLAVDADRKPEGGAGRADAKIGFCFFDYGRALGRGFERPQYSRLSCGKRDDSRIAMGLSLGWGDTYSFDLPGQRIDVTDLADGRYRLVADVDEASWFREVSRANNRTWIDLVLSTKDELRFATVVAVGPKPK